MILNYMFKPLLPPLKDEFEILNQYARQLPCNI